MNEDLAINCKDRMKESRPRATFLYLDYMFIFCDTPEQCFLYIIFGARPVDVMEIMTRLLEPCSIHKDATGMKLFRLIHILIVSKTARPC